jgi:hypothetical protein
MHMLFPNAYMMVSYSTLAAYLDDLLEGRFTLDFPTLSLKVWFAMLHNGECRMQIQ